jgi:lactoylglutathione lyase
MDLRLAHTAINVKDMNVSLNFYVEKLGMKLIKRKYIPENNAEIAFVSDGNSNHLIELTNWKNNREYNEGDQLDHLAFKVDDIEKTLSRLKNGGVNIAKDIFTLSTSEKRMAFITDPNNIWIELIEDKQ